MKTVHKMYFTVIEGQKNRTIFAFERLEAVNFLAFLLKK